MSSNDFNEDGYLSGEATAAMTGLTFAKQATTVNETFKFTKAGAGEDTCGVNTADAGAATYPVSIATKGVGLLLVNGSTGGAIAKGDRLKPDSSAYGVKALPGEAFGAIALEPSTADGEKIRVLIVAHGSRTAPGYVETSDTTATIAATDFRGGACFLNHAYAGATTVAMPAATEVAPGARLFVKKTHATAGAATLDPTGSGTIAGSTTHAAIDANGDMAEFHNTGATWVLGSSAIA